MKSVFVLSLIAAVSMPAFARVSSEHQGLRMERREIAAERVDVRQDRRALDGDRHEREFAHWNEYLANRAGDVQGARQWARRAQEVRRDVGADRRELFQDRQDLRQDRAPRRTELARR